jgi:hypothetical protein
VITDVAVTVVVVVVVVVVIATAFSIIRLPDSEQVERVESNDRSFFLSQLLGYDNHNGDV